MRRRPFLATVATGATIGVSGCLDGGHVEMDVHESVRIEPLRGEWWEIEEIGSAEVGYTVRSDVHTFQTFYFTSYDEFNQYQSYVMGEDVDDQPSGHDELRMTAVQDEDGIYEARRPVGGGRLSIDIDEPHYFVVDYSDYHQDIYIDEYSDALSATVNLEVVDSHFGFF